MRIFAVADLHGRADRLDDMARMIDRHDPDAVVVAGDITGWRHHRNAIRGLNQLSVPVLAVTGNGDSTKTVRLLESSANITHLHLKRRVVQDQGFCGAGGAVPIPFRSRMAWRENRLLQTLGNVLRRGDTLVTHCPPYGVLDRVLGRFNGGSKGLRSMIEAVGPRLVICGHIHF